MVRWCWTNFQCWDVLLIWIIVGQGPTVLTVGAGGGCLDIFSLLCHFSLLSPSLWETVRYRLKLSQRTVKPKTTNQNLSETGVHSVTLIENSSNMYFYLSLLLLFCF